MIDAQVAQAIAELRECWPYQEIPERHLRHWRDVLGAYPQAVVNHVLNDAKITMKGRPTWGEFGALCHSYEMASARRKHHGPFLEDWGDAVPANEPGWQAECDAAKAAIKTNRRS